MACGHLANKEEGRYDLPKKDPEISMSKGKSVRGEKLNMRVFLPQKRTLVRKAEDTFLSP